jgi:hypothetical protein
MSPERTVGHVSGSDIAVSPHKTFHADHAAMISVGAGLRLSRSAVATLITAA